MSMNCRGEFAPSDDYAAAARASPMGCYAGMSSGVEPPVEIGVLDAGRVPSKVTGISLLCHTNAVAVGVDLVVGCDTRSSIAKLQKGVSQLQIRWDWLTLNRVEVPLPRL